jgi:hypothetical protein
MMLLQTNDHIQAKQVLDKAEAINPNIDHKMLGNISVILPGHHLGDSSLRTGIHYASTTKIFSKRRNGRIENAIWTYVTSYCAVLLPTSAFLLEADDASVQNQES